MPESFASRFAAVRKAKGPLVWGLDPSGALLEDWGLGDTPDGLDRFADLVLPVAAATASAGVGFSRSFEANFGTSGLISMSAKRPLRSKSAVPAGRGP